MNEDLLQKHIESYAADAKKNPEQFDRDRKERLELTKYYRAYNREDIVNMKQEEIYEYIARLWAMQMWGNKQYRIDKLIEENKFDNLKVHVADLVWGTKPIAVRWDGFRKEIRGMGPAMISELLCKTHPDDYMLWNRRAHVGLSYLGVENLPQYDYQLTGQVYEYLCGIAKQIASRLSKAGLADSSLLATDYFIWQDLQIEGPAVILAKQPTEESKFIHDDIRDKLGEIGQWLGFTAKTEQKVAEGSRIDTVWEVTIGNMGRIMYVFEVQKTEGRIDSLIVNLLQSLNNPAVQGVVAVSDKKQIESIKKRAVTMKGLVDKLRYWDYESVLKVHENLEYVNSTINELKLVPERFE